MHTEPLVTSRLCVCGGVASNIPFVLSAHSLLMTAQEIDTITPIFGAKKAKPLVDEVACLRSPCGDCKADLHCCNACVSTIYNVSWGGGCRKGTLVLWYLQSLGRAKRCRCRGSSSLPREAVQMNGSRTRLTIPKLGTSLGRR